MYDRIGKKIKGLANALMIIGIVLSVISGCIMIADSHSLILPGLIVIIVGCLGAWLGNLVLYGFGELVDKTCDMEELLRASINQNGMKAPGVNNVNTHAEAAPVMQQNAAPVYTPPQAPVYTNSSMTSGGTEILSETKPMSEVPPTYQGHVENNIFCKRCGTKYDLSISDYCPVCGCQNRR